MRNRSAFLFTAIISTSALLLSSNAALSRRLLLHSQKLAQNVTTSHLKSTEIVLAFVVHATWLSPGNHWANDETNSYLSTALRVAIDLSLDKAIKYTSDDVDSRHAGCVPQSDCVSARKALNLDGFPDVDPATNWGKRLLRSRERAWYALFAFERGCVNTYN